MFKDQRAFIDFMLVEDLLEAAMDRIAFRFEFSLSIRDYKRFFFVKKAFKTQRFSMGRKAFYYFLCMKWLSGHKRTPYRGIL